MNIGIVTGAYGGYGRWIVQWCEYVAALTPAPAAATMALGTQHGATPEDIERARAVLPMLRLVRAPSAGTMGRIRNAAVRKTYTDWLQWLSIDDGILPDAIARCEPYAADADWLCTGWLTRGLGQPEMRHQSPLPVEMAGRRGRGFVIGHSPFRRWLWKRHPYPVHNYPNAPFLADAIETGARFVKVPRPVTIYLRRSDSHSRTMLQGPQRSIEEKHKAIHHKRDMQRRVIAYYAKETKS